MPKNNFTIFNFLILSLFSVSCNLKSTPKSETVEAPISYLIEGKADVLVYTGRENWASEAAALRQVLYNNKVSYNEITPRELNDISLEDLLKSKLLIMPGGDSDLISAALYTETGIKLRKAIQEHGFSFLGFCAGAWLAVAPKPKAGMDPTYGLGLVEGPLLKHTYLKGLKFAAPLITFADGSKRRQLWWGGPVTPEAPGGVFARYEDGNPAISQMWSGQGFVILSGIHPTANKAILTSIDLFVREAIAPEISWQLIDSALNKKPLPSF